MKLSDDQIRAFRVRMPRHERRFGWLPMLLDCYAVIDFSVAAAIEQSEKSVACRKGCSACCHQKIPLSALECAGLRFYVQNVLSPEQQALVRARLGNPGSICLFNVDDGCIVYPLRPIACRRYIVCSRQCEINEDPTETRPADVLRPSREYLHRAVELTLGFYQAQNIRLRPGEPAFDFYKRNNVILSSVYANIISGI